MIITQKEKANSLGQEYQEELNKLLNWYFEDYENNKDSFDKINLEWKKLCYIVNNKQKLIKLKINAFEVEVSRIIAENPEFQIIKDLTKI